MQAPRVPRIASAVLLSVTCQAAGIADPIAGPRPGPVTWSFDLHHDRATNPHCNVFLRVNTRRILILRDAGSEFTVLTRAEYRDHTIPSEAVAACTGWWAGQGEDLYVVRRKAQLVIYRRETDESTASTPAYRRLKTVTLAQ